MSTISVPLPSILEEFIDKMVKSGEAANKADVVRRALIKYREEQALNSLLKARREENLSGDLDELARIYR